MPGDGIYGFDVHISPAEEDSGGGFGYGGG